MLETATHDLAQAIDDLQSLTAAALTEQTSERFASIEQVVNRVDVYIRELQQSIWKPQVKKAIEHLETGRPLSREDVATIRAMVVNDAEFYLKHENNLADWLEELQRLIHEMSELAALPGEEALSDLRGVTCDASRLLPQIRVYMEDKDRLARFEAALSHLDAPNRTLLSQILREKMMSARR